MREITETILIIFMAFFVFLSLADLVTKDRHRAGRKSKIPADSEDKEEDEEEPSEVMLREAFWVCDECGQEFRLDSDSAPRFCPGCGAPVADDDDVAPDEYGASTYSCPKCFTKFSLLDGGFPECCPSCGYGNRPEDTMSFLMEDEDDEEDEE